LFPELEEKKNEEWIWEKSNKIFRNFEKDEKFCTGFKNLYKFVKFEENVIFE
jgi:hypothetical protein